MSSPPVNDQSRRPRATLSREAIVDAAVRILETDGLEALTMRRVADELGAGAMSLYRHVAGREELLDLVVERLSGEIEPVVTSGAWRADIIAVAYGVRAALLRRPALTVLLTSRAGVRPSGLASLDVALRIFRDAGFTPGDAALANHALGNYVAGAALWEAVGLDGATGPERTARADAAARAVAAIDPDRYPGISWASRALFAGTAEDRFAFGLDVLLDGLERMAGPAAT